MNRNCESVQAVKSHFATDSVPQRGLGISRKYNIGFRTFLDTFSVSVFIQICTIVQGVIIARLLGPVGRGEYAAIILWPNLFAAVGIFGSNIALARIASKSSDEMPVFRSALLLSIFTAAISMVPCYITIPWLMPESEEHLVNLARFFSLFILLNHIALNLVSVDHGTGNFSAMNFTRALLYPTYLLMLTVLYLSNLVNLFWLVLSLLVANLFVVMSRLILAFRRHPIYGKFYPINKVFKKSIYFGLAGMINPFYQQFDKAFLLWLLGSENLGLYMVALSASAVVGSVTSATGIVTFTMAAQAERGEGFTSIAKAFRISLMLWIFFGLILAFVMPWVLPLVYGVGFITAIVPAQLLIVGSAFSGLSSQLEQAMRGQGRAFVGIGGRMVGLIVMGALGMLFASIYGLVGVCVAYNLGQLTSLIFIIYRTHCHYGSDSYLLVYLPTIVDAKAILGLIPLLIKGVS